MAGDPAVLDEAFDRMGRTDFQLPNGFVNHGPMACEALDALGLDRYVDGWARRIEASIAEGPAPATSTSLSTTAWEDAIGDYHRLPEWLTLFGREVDEQGWEATVALWVPRLMPALSTALYHGVIRTAHAVRAVDAADTPSRRAELARALGYWAARYHPGPPPSGAGTTERTDAGTPQRMDVGTTERTAAGTPVPADAGWSDDAGGPVPVDRDLLAAAAGGARHYVAGPTIFALHGVTGAMAVALLVPHLPPDAGTAALAQLRADHLALYGRDPAARNGDPTATTEPSDRWEDGAASAAAGSRDPHQVKLVEACRRGWQATADRAFADAARTVTARSRRPAGAGSRSR
jgi:hypothetical protein